MAYIGNYPAETQTVDLKWQSVKTASFTAVAGEGYWINTTSGAVTVTLPASANAGDTIEFSDYARTWGTNAVTINQNSLNFQGNSSPNPVYDVDGQSVRIVYSGATQGWIPTSDDDVTFETSQAYDAEYLLVAGGGSGGGGDAAGGGAGGHLTNFGGTAIALTPGAVYTVTVGGGGAAAGSPGAKAIGNDGDDSTVSGTGVSLTAIGGGGGAAAIDPAPNRIGRDGGSGGGGAASNPGGSGTVGQGNDGGDNIGGGGGAGAAGTTPNGGNGLANSITGSSVTRAGGGGAFVAPGGSSGSGGSGGGTNGAPSPSPRSSASPANTGGGTGGGDNGGSGAGGSGVVILRMATSDYSGTTSGSPTVSTDGSDTILTFNASGSYTA